MNHWSLIPGFRTVAENTPSIAKPRRNRSERISLTLGPIRGLPHPRAAITKGCPVGRGFRRMGATHAGIKRARNLGKPGQAFPGFSVTLITTPWSHFEPIQTVFNWQSSALPPLDRQPIRLWPEPPDLTGTHQERDFSEGNQEPDAENPPLRGMSKLPHAVHGERL